MRSKNSMPATAACVALFSACMAWADVPAPPVNQNLGMPDVRFATYTEADCRICHSNGVPDRHHMLYDQPIIPGTVVPYPDSDGDGAPDEIYDCLNCHDANFTVVGDCLACHTTSPHHAIELAQSGNCVACHGDFVDNMDDGHYIPTYAPSLVTPRRSLGEGLPVNSRDRGAGACDYCHDQDRRVPPVILSNQDLHHGIQDCSWCHDFALPFDSQIRICEGCHGPDALHNIQGDSPNPNNIGLIIVGGEDAGYGHVGRDGGSGDSDCWGCHGFAMNKAALVPGPVVPSLGRADCSAVTAGTPATVALSGAAFVNRAGATEYRSEVALKSEDGVERLLKPNRLEGSSLEFTVPADVAPGNYEVRVVKGSVASNPAVISVRPAVHIDEATGRKTITIHGRGFGGYAEGSGTRVTATVAAVKGWHRKPPIMEASIVSWSDTEIVAEFRSVPEQVTVHSVFGTAKGKVSRTGGRRTAQP